MLEIILIVLCVVIAGRFSKAREPGAGKYIAGVWVSLFGIVILGAFLANVLYAGFLLYICAVIAYITSFAIAISGMKAGKGYLEYWEKNQSTGTAPASSKPPAPANKPSILVRYRAALSYLDGCGNFDESKLRECNRISGDMFSESDIQNQLKSAQMMIRGMEEVKSVLRNSLVEAISVFEKLERQGIDLSKYDV